MAIRARALAATTPPPAQGRPISESRRISGGEAGGRAKSGISDDLSVTLAKNGRWCGSALSLKSETIRSCGVAPPEQGAMLNGRRRVAADSPSPVVPPACPGRHLSKGSGGCNPLRQTPLPSLWRRGDSHAPPNDASYPDRAVSQGWRTCRSGGLANLPVSPGDVSISSALDCPSNSSSSPHAAESLLES